MKKILKNQKEYIALCKFFYLINMNYFLIQYIWA